MANLWKFQMYRHNAGWLRLLSSTILCDNKNHVSSLLCSFTSFSFNSVCCVPLTIVTRWRHLSPSIFFCLYLSSSSSLSLSPPSLLLLLLLLPLFLSSFSQDIIREYIDISYDKLPELTTYFHSLLMLPSPTVIYSHCEVCTAWYYLANKAFIGCPKCCWIKMFVKRSCTT